MYSLASNESTYEVEKTFKKADNVINLIVFGLSTVNTVLSVVYEYWRPLFIPILLVLSAYVIVMKLRIIFENDVVEGFRKRLALWFGIALIGIVPIVSLVGIEFFAQILGLVFSPVETGGYGFFDYFLLIPFLLEFAIPFLITKKIGKLTLSNISEENMQLKLKLSKICDFQFFSASSARNYFVMLIFSFGIILFGVFFRIYYFALYQGFLDIFISGLPLLIFWYSSMFVLLFWMFTTIYLTRNPLPSKAITIATIILLLLLVLLYIPLGAKIVSFFFGT